MGLSLVPFERCTGKPLQSTRVPASPRALGHASTINSEGFLLLLVCRSVQPRGEHQAVGDCAETVLIRVEPWHQQRQELCQEAAAPLTNVTGSLLPGECSVLHEECARLSLHIH